MYLTRLLALLCCLLASFTAMAGDELALYLFRSPLGINWKSPYSMAMSTVKNQIAAELMKKRAFSISHVFVELKCDSQNYFRRTGMTSVGTDEIDLVFKEKYGLGVMFQTYAGKLEPHHEVDEALAQYKGSKRKSELRFKISANACERLITYLNEYEAAGFGSLYSGLQARPRKGEGAGCSAFAMSFLELAGLLSDDWNDQWQERIHIPTRFIGGPLTNQRVDIMKIITRPFAKWSAKEPNIYLEAWNPEKIHSWVRSVWAQARDEGSVDGYEAWADQEGKSRIVTLDVTHVPVPQDPIWQ